MYGGDGRDPEVAQCAEDSLPEASSFRPLHRILDGFDCGDVCPRNKPSLRAPQHDDAHLASGSQIPHLIQMLPKSRKHLLTEHVHFTLRVVEGDPGNPPLVNLKGRICVGQRVGAHDVTY